MHLVEDEMLELRPEISAVAEPRALKISFGLLRDVARVAAVRPACDGIGNAADQDQGRRFCEGVTKRRRRIGKDEHVALLDLLESAN